MGSIFNSKYANSATLLWEMILNGIDDSNHQTFTETASLKQKTPLPTCQPARLAGGQDGQRDGVRSNLSNVYVWP